MATYKIIVKDPVSGDIVELQPKSYSFTDELNKESTAKISVGFEEVKKIAELWGSTVLAVFTTAYRELWIERDGIKIFWGVITNFEVVPDQQGARTINLDCTSWFGLLGQRVCGVPVRIFTGVDAGTIAWTLINETQTDGSVGDDLGILMGTITTSKNRDRTYRFDNVKDSIFKLSNNNLKDGFDFDIDNTKHFNVYYPTKGSDKPEIVFDERTAANYRYKKPLILSVATRVHVLGAGQNDDILYVTRNAADSYKTDFLLQEKVLNERDIIETATLNDKGDKYLDLYKAPIPEFSVEHYDDLIKWEDYALGDTIRVNFPELGFSTASKRVMKRDFSMDPTKSIAYIKLTLQ